MPTLFFLSLDRKIMGIRIEDDEIGALANGYRAGVHSRDVGRIARGGDDHFSRGHADRDQTFQIHVRGITDEEPGLAGVGP